jgi:acetoin utilization deacetylase AcuC-like enzyme
VPIAQEFRPDFVLVSAGFDSHVKDPLASMAVTSLGYGLFTDVIKEIAKKSCGGRIVMTLEGGYNLDAIAESVLSVFNSLLSDRGAEKSGAVGLTERILQRVEEIRKVQRDYWNL